MISTVVICNILAGQVSSFNSKRVQWVKMFTTRPDNLSSTPDGRRRLILNSCPLTYIDTHIHTQHTLENAMKKKLKSQADMVLVFQAKDRKIRSFRRVKTNLKMEPNRNKTYLQTAAHTFNSSTLDAEAGESLGVQGQPDLHSEVRTSRGYTWNFAKNTKTKTKQITSSYKNTLFNLKTLTVFMNFLSWKIWTLFF